MIGKRRCSALIDLADVNNSLLCALRVLSADVISTFRINPRDFSRAFSPITYLPSFSHALTCLCVTLCTCTLGLSWLGLWKVPGQTPSRNNKRVTASKHTGLLRLTLAWESRLEFPAETEMTSSSVYFSHSKGQCASAPALPLQTQRGSKGYRIVEREKPFYSKRLFPALTHKLIKEPSHLFLSSSSVTSNSHYVFHLDVHESRGGSVSGT